MTVYRDVEHGVVRAMTLDAISLHKGAAWQNKYHPGGWEPGKSDNPCPLDRFDQLTQDAMTRSLLRRVLSPLHWNLLEAFYKVDNSKSLQQERAQAIQFIAGQHRKGPLAIPDEVRHVLGGVEPAGRLHGAAHLGQP